MGSKSSKTKRKGSETKTAPLKKRSPPAKRAVRWMSLNDFEEEIACGRYIRFAEHPDVKMCVKKIAELVSSMTIYLMKNSDAGDVRVVNGLSRVLDIIPNKYLTRQKLIYKVVEEMALTGNSVLIPRYDSPETPQETSFVEEYLSELIPIPQSRIEYFDKPDGGYYITSNGVVKDYDEIIHFTYGQDAERPWLGTGVKICLNDVLRNLSDARQIKDDYFKRHYKPNIIFSFMADTAEFTSDETREILYDKWLKTKPGTPYILPAQIIDVKSYPQMTLKDIAVNESVALDKREIAAMFGLPLFLIGQGKYDENEYNNFIDITIAPIVKGMAQELTKKLIISERYYIKFNLESLKAFKTETKIGVMYEGKKAGVFNANEIRVLAGYEPIDEPAMNSYNILENYIPIEKLGDQKKIN